MIKTISDNETIYFLLEETEMLLKDFNADAVIPLDKDDDFYVIVYTGSARKFFALVAEGCRQDHCLLYEMLDKAEEIRTKDSTLITDEVIKIIQEKIHSMDNSHFYFDAH